MLALSRSLLRERLGLTLNCGSSSIKYKVIDVDSERVHVAGHIESIGSSSCSQKVGDMITPKPGCSYGESMKDVISSVRELPGVQQHGLYCVGHRVVHGGDIYKTPVVIDQAVQTTISDLCSLAPLHNPINLQGITLAQDLLSPEVPHVAVFDTSFHSTIPRYANLYALPLDISEHYKIKRYGFHGISHKFVSLAAAANLEIPTARCNVIVAHLGSGCSATAVKGGMSVETTMGFTPLEGLIMSTRAGQLDPGVESYLSRVMGIGLDEIGTILNKKSGLLGVSGLSPDMRVLLAASSGRGNFSDEQRSRSSLAIEMFVYRLSRHIAALLVSLQAPCHGLVFTGGIGEGSVEIREMVLERLRFMGLFLDTERNETPGLYGGVITADDSPLKALVIPTNEELQIAREAKELLK